MNKKALFCLALSALISLCGGLTIKIFPGMADGLKPPIDFSSTDSSDSSGSFIPIQPGDRFDKDEEEEIDPMPSRYCLRDEYILHTQHQGEEGYCWNFAATMSASTTIMRHTGEYYDFSEAWSGLLSLYANNSYMKVGSGGNFSHHYNAIKYGGLMLETDLPYQNTYTISNENADDYYDFFAQYSSDNLVDCLAQKSLKTSQIEEAKNHIYKYGSVYGVFWFKQGFVADENGVYALPPNQTDTSSLHAVSIIGWDDDYQREFYLDGSDTPTVFKGAWIVMNSYMEKSGTDGISFVFYEDENLASFYGYTYKQKTTGNFYFYDKIEKGYAYPNKVVGKYYGDFTAQEGVTKQKNIFYDDVNLEYSYVISEGASLRGINIYLDNVDVTKEFDVRIDAENKRFYIAKKGASYGQYKVLVSYGNATKTDTYLNNFFVTYGLLGEKQELDTKTNNLAFNTGRDLEYYSVSRSGKNYVIYTNEYSGTLSFLPIHQSIYSDKNMSIPALSYQITDGNSTVLTHTITSTSGYNLQYNFNVEYYADTSLQPVQVFYDLEGGANHPKNYDKELASATTDLTLYTPTKEGYVFDGWYLDYGDHIEKLKKQGETYCIGWEDIHHMGEAPTLYASSYYTKYYNNSNVVFVRASWVKKGDVQSKIILNVEGQGQVTADRDLQNVTYGDSRTLTLSADDGWKIDSVFVNGERVGVTDGQLILEDVKADTYVVVVFEKKINVTFLATVITLSAVILGVSTALIISLVKKRKRIKQM